MQAKRCEKIPLKNSKRRRDRNKKNWGKMAKQNDSSKAYKAYEFVAL